MFVRACPARYTGGPNWPTFRAVTSQAGEKPAGELAADLATAGITWPPGDAERLAAAGATPAVVRRGVEMALGVAAEARRVLPAEQEIVVNRDVSAADVAAGYSDWAAAAAR